jgi:hypothetical protein
MIIQEYERIVLNIKSLKRKLYLPFLLKTFLVLPNQDQSYIRELRKSGKKIRLIKGTYQVLIEKRNVSWNSKLAIVERIFNLNFFGKPLFLELQNKFITNAVPNMNFYNSTEYMLILDNLATFLISNHDNSDFLTDRASRKCKRYELFSFEEDIPYELFDNLIINNKNKYTKHITDRPKMQIRRWKKSKTCKLNMLIKELGKYKANWCYLNELNEFLYEDKNYVVTDPIYYKKLNGMYIYNEILVIEANGEVLFYNMEIDLIDNIHIHRKD